ncbi:MAG: hypothetical protein HYV28_14170 [Ignavibacteriales bacterium]|nr:hypothetical protein [Ignavibacteriales bacterium]
MIFCSETDELQQIVLQERRQIIPFQTAAVFSLLLISSIRDIEKAMSDGVKRVYESEYPVKKKLRKFESLHTNNKAS